MSGPTTGSAETLAEALFAACCKVGPTVDTKDLAAELIASDWMKRHDAEVRGEAMREVADAEYQREGATLLVERVLARAALAEEGDQ